MVTTGGIEPPTPRLWKTGHENKTELNQLLTFCYSLELRCKTLH